MNVLIFYVLLIIEMGKLCKDAKNIKIHVNLIEKRLYLKQMGAIHIVF